MPPLKIHHLQYSQSERIPWLLTELSLSNQPIPPYSLILHRRAPYLSPPDLAALHPMRAAPVLQDGELTLGESGAIIEYILDVYAPASPLKIRAGEKGYVQYIYWWHWANANLQPCIMRCVTLARANFPEAEAAKRNVQERLDVALRFLNGHLRGKGVEYLAGPEGGFSAADVMILFSLTTMRRFWGYSLEGYEGILAYLGRVGEREGYQRAMREMDPEMDWREALRGEVPRGFAEVGMVKNGKESKA